MSKRNRALTACLSIILALLILATVLLGFAVSRSAFSVADDTYVGEARWRLNVTPLNETGDNVQSFDKETPSPVYPADDSADNGGTSSFSLLSEIRNDGDVTAEVEVTGITFAGVEINEEWSLSYNTSGNSPCSKMCVGCSGCTCTHTSYPTTSAACSCTSSCEYCYYFTKGFMAYIRTNGSANRNYIVGWLSAEAYLSYEDAGKAPDSGDGMRRLEDVGKITLEPGGSAYIYLKIFWNPDATQISSTTSDVFGRNNTNFPISIWRSNDMLNTWMSTYVKGLVFDMDYTVTQAD